MESQFKDALGREIVVGKCYGFSQIRNGLSLNRTVLVLSFHQSAPTSWGHVRLKVKTLTVDRGYGNDCISPIRTSTIEHFETFWPIHAEFALKDECCQLLKKEYGNRKSA